jgi:tetratricopeptide (TPR) repeat protein
MLVDEILEAAMSIPEPYTKALTYAKIGGILAGRKDAHYKEAFIKAFEALNEIDDPMTLLRATLGIAYHLRKAGLKPYRKVFMKAIEESRTLSPVARDEILTTAVRYLLATEDVGDATMVALEISDRKLMQETLVAIIKSVSRAIEKGSIKSAYKLRRLKLALEYLEDEPYRSKGLLELSKALISLGSYKSAFTAVREMNSPEWAKIAFKELTFRLSERGVIEEYIESFKILAEEFSSRFGSDYAVELATAFVLAGKPEIALGIFRTRENSVEEIAEAALEAIEKNPSVIPALIENLREDEVETVGRAILNWLIDHPSASFEPVVVAILKKKPPETLLVKAARYYSLIGKVEASRGIGATISDPRLRSLVLADVARNYLKEGRIDEAIDVALEVRDRHYTSLLMSEILVKALKSGEG